MLPEAVTQQLGWNPALAPPPIDPAAAPAPPPDWLHPAVLQGLGIAPAGQPAPQMPAPGRALADPSAPAPPPDGTPAPPAGGDWPTIGGPGAQLPSAASATPASGPAPDRDFHVTPPGGAAAPPAHPAPPAKPLSIDQQMTANQAKLEQATQEEKTAVNAQTQAKVGEAADAYQAEQTYAAKEADLMQQAARQRDDRAQYEALAHRSTMDRMKALDDYKIDANKYWNDMGVGSKIGMFIGMALSGIGNALSGKGDAPNPVIQMLQEKMKQSIQLQQDKRDQLEKQYGRAKDEEQSVSLREARKAADNAAAQTDATKMLKIAVDLGTAKAADPIQRANGAKESAGLSRQLALDTGNEIDKKAKLYQAQQQIGIAGGHLALDRKKFELETAWKSWEQNRDQQKLDLQGAKEALAERKAIGDKDLQLGVSAPVPDGQGGVATGMLTQKDGTVWHANKPEEATKVQDTVAATTSYNRLVGKMITGIQKHGGESSYLKSDDYQTMVVDLEHATAELHKAYDVPFRGESTIQFLQKLATGGVDPTSFMYNATRALQEGATDLQDRVNDKLRAANYTGKPISFAPLDAPSAVSPQDKQLTSLKDNSTNGPMVQQAAGIASAAGYPDVAANATGLTSKLQTIATLGQQLESQGPGAKDAAQMLQAVASDTTTVDPKVRAAAQQALDTAATKRQAASYQAGDKSYSVIHPASPQGRALDAQSHIPGIISRINQGAGPPTLP